MSYPRKRLTEQQRTKLLSMLQSGEYSTAQIAEKVGCAACTVYHYQQKSNVPRKSTATQPTTPIKPIGVPLTPKEVSAADIRANAAYQEELQYKFWESENNGIVLLMASRITTDTVRYFVDQALEFASNYKK